MPIEGVAFQYTDKGQRTAFEKAEAKKCGPGVGGAGGMKSAGPNTVGSQRVRNGDFIIVQG